MPTTLQSDPSAPEIGGRVREESTILPGLRSATNLLELDDSLRQEGEAVQHAIEMLEEFQLDVDGVSLSDISELEDSCRELHTQLGERNESLFISEMEMDHAAHAQESMAALRAAKVEMDEAWLVYESHQIDDEFLFEHSIPMPAIQSAFNSKSQAALLTRCLSEQVKLSDIISHAVPLWAEEGTLRSLGEQLVLDMMRNLKKAGHGQDEQDTAALVLITMRKQTQLKVVYAKLIGDKKMADFLAKDFSQASHKMQAQKNAYRLLSLHRIHLAAAFFLLCGEPEAAIDTLAIRGRQPFLATLVTRLHCGDHTPACRLMADIFLPEAEEAEKETAQEALGPTPRVTGQSPTLKSEAPRGGCRKKYRSAGRGCHSAEVTARSSQAITIEVHRACVGLWCRDYAAEWAAGPKDLVLDTVLHTAGGQTSLCGYDAAKWHSERLYAYRRGGMNLFALHAGLRHLQVPGCRDYDALVQPCMVSLVAAALLPHFWDETGEWSGPRGRYIMSQGALRGIQDGAAVASILNLDVEEIWRSLRGFCRRRDLLEPEVCLVLYTHPADSLESTLQAVILIEAAGQQLITMLARDLQAAREGQEHAVCPYEWLKKARSLIHCMEHIMQHEPGRFGLYQHVYSMVIVQVLLGCLGLCLARNDFDHVPPFHSIYLHFTSIYLHFTLFTSISPLFYLYFRCNSSWTSSKI